MNGGHLLTIARMQEGLWPKGYIDLSGNIVCPIHSYKFSLKNGRSKILKVFA